VTRLIKEGKDDIFSAIIKDYVSCTPEMTLEEIFPLVTDSEIPIAVVDEENRLVGFIRNHMIIESMIQEDSENSDEGAKGNV
jgi:glycine betaine/proline transport system ATP-binding protein